MGVISFQRALIWELADRALAKSIGSVCGNDVFCDMIKYYLQVETVSIYYLKFDFDCGG